MALVAAQGHFFFVSQSLAKIIGYPVVFTYQKGPSLLQQIITTHDRPLVDQLIKKSESILAQENTKPYPRISFDYHILSGQGTLKRIFQHILPNAMRDQQSTYTVIILQDLTGFKNTCALNYLVSFLNDGNSFTTIGSGKINPPCPYPLTKREIKLLESLAQGKSIQKIADEVFTSVETQKKHRNNILKKTGAPNTLALIEEGLRLGWIDSIIENP